MLEVGAGSGYAAAVLGQVAGDVIAIERHAELVALARERIARLGYDDAASASGSRGSAMTMSASSHGDGTLGWPEEAPFDAILAAASGEDVPPALVEQLKPGGRLVMPLGGRWSVQSLVGWSSARTAASSAIGCARCASFR